MSKPLMHECPACGVEFADRALSIANQELARLRAAPTSAEARKSADRLRDLVILSWNISDIEALRRIADEHESLARRVADLERAQEIRVRAIHDGQRRVAELERQLAEAQEEGRKDYDGMREMQAKFIAADHALQKAQEQARQNAEDAARYRWLREPPISGGKRDWLYMPHSAELDTMIDTYLAAGQTGRSAGRWGLQGGSATPRDGKKGK